MEQQNKWFIILDSYSIDFCKSKFNESEGFIRSGIIYKDLKGFNYANHDYKTIQSLLENNYFEVNEATAKLTISKFAGEGKINLFTLKDRVTKDNEVLDMVITFGMALGKGFCKHLLTVDKNHTQEHQGLNVTSELPYKINSIHRDIIVTTKINTVNITQYYQKINVEKSKLKELIKVLTLISEQ